MCPAKESLNLFFRSPCAMFPPACRCFALALQVDAAVKAAKEAVEKGQSSVVMEVSACELLTYLVGFVSADGWIEIRGRRSS